MTAAFDPYHRWLGIRPVDQPADHYRLLGLACFEDDVEVIRDAAERQMGHVRRYCMGKHAQTAHRLLNELAAAKACLLQPARKAEYDAELLARQAAPPAAAGLAGLAEAVRPAEKRVDSAPPHLDQRSPRSRAAATRAAQPGQPGQGLVRQAAQRPRQPGKRVNDVFRTLVWSALALPIGLFAAWQAWPHLMPHRSPTSVGQAAGAGQGNAGDLRPGEPGEEQSGAMAAIGWEQAEAAGQPPGAGALQPTAANGKPTEASGGAIDLLATIRQKPPPEMIGGRFRFSGGMLYSDQRDFCGFVAFPIDVPRNYRLTAEVDILDGQGTFQLGLVVEGRTVILILDGYGTIKSGLTLVDGRGADNNPTTVSGSVLRRDVSNRVVVSVVEGQVAVSVNDRRIVAWSGSPERLSFRRDLWSVPENRLFVGTSYTDHRVSRLELADMTEVAARPPLE